MGLQQITCDDRWLANADGQAFRLHAVLHGENALLEQLARWTVSLFACVCRHSACLLGEGQIWISRLIGGLHCWIAGQSGGDAEFLLRPVDVSEAMSGRGLDQRAQPYARAQDEFRITWLIPPGARAKSRKDRPVATVGANSQVVEPQLGKCAAQLANRRHFGMGFRHLPECVVAEVKAAAR